MSLQDGVSYMDAGEEHKWEVGRILTFEGYSPSEPYYGLDVMFLKPGDKLSVLPTNACGMGIDVVRLSDLRKTMVFPEEVTHD